MARWTGVIIRGRADSRSSSAFRAAGILNYRYRLDRNGSIEYGDRDRYLTDVFSEAAVDFIDRHQGEPFFLQLAYNAPHFPLEAPDAIAQNYVEKGFSLGVSLLYAMIEVMDAASGASWRSWKPAASPTIRSSSSPATMVRPWAIGTDSRSGASTTASTAAKAILTRRHPRASDHSLVRWPLTGGAHRRHGAFHRLVSHAAKDDGRRGAD